MNKNKFVFCSECGEKNPADAKFCSHCGAKLRNIKKDQQVTAKNKTRPTIRRSSANVKGAKIFPMSKVIVILVVLLIGGGIMLVLSGQLDTPELKNAVKNIPQNNIPAQHGGADLNALKEIKDLEDKYNKNPNDLNVLLTLAHKLNDSKFYDKAITYYLRYLKKKPNDADVLVDMGVCYFELQNFDKAISVMKKAIKINPKHQIAHFNIGIVNFASGNKTGARKWWKKAIEIDPNTRIAEKAKELLEKNN